MKDIIGKELKISDPILFPYRKYGDGTIMGYGRVTKKHAIMIGVYVEGDAKIREEDIVYSWRSRSKRIRPDNCIKITEKQYREILESKNIIIENNLSFWQRRAEKDSEIFSF
jgi:hypothetical protein